MSNKLSDFSIDQFVIALKQLVDPPSGDSPGGVCANRGELLVVRSINNREGAEWPLAVSHEHRTDASFSAGVDEVRPAGKIMCRAQHSPNQVFIEFLGISSSALKYVVWDTTNILDDAPPRYMTLDGAKNEARLRCKRQVDWIEM